MKTYVVIPAYNEARYLAETLAQVRSLGQYRIVVVDDGSSDETFALASKVAPTVRHCVNRGMGAALVTGTQYALREGADYIVHFDADGQHRASEIAELLAPLLCREADIALGSRYLKENKLPWTKRFLIHKPALLFQNLSTGLRLTDVHNGFRAMTRAAAELITLRQDRMAHASEIISEIRRHRLRFVEVPVTIAYREYGQGFIGGMKVYLELLSRKIFK